MDKKEKKCAYCKSVVNGRIRYETLKLCRWVKEPGKEARKQNLCLVIPSCESCHHVIHPETNIFVRFAIIASILLFFAITWGFIQKDAFSTNLIGALFSYAIAIFIGIGFTYVGYFFTSCLFDDAFVPSYDEEPHTNLPIVRFAIENGFRAEDDQNVVKSDSNNYIPLSKIHEVAIDYLDYKTKLSMK